MLGWKILSVCFEFWAAISQRCGYGSVRDRGESGDPWRPAEMALSNCPAILIFKDFLLWYFFKSWRDKVSHCHPVITWHNIARPGHCPYEASIDTDLTSKPSQNMRSKTLMSFKTAVLLFLFILRISSKYRSYTKIKLLDGWSTLKFHLPHKVLTINFFVLAADELSSLWLF